MKQIITSLDLGSNSIKIVVGEIYNEELFVLACTEVKSKGIKKGIIVDEEKARECIKEALDKTESVLGIKINRVVLVSPSYYASFIKGEGYITITREDKRITGEDITHVLQASVYNRVSANLELVSVSGLDYIINEEKAVDDPKNIEATRLSVNSLLGVIPKKNIIKTIEILEKMNVKVVDLAFGGQVDYYTYRKDEYKNKIGAVIDIGSDKTEVSIINKDVLVNTEVLDIGSKNIDRDISYIYDLTLEDSKKLKETFALAHKSNASTNETVECLTKSEEHIKINQYEVSEIVYSRLREILELSKKQINLLTKKEISYIIITGGCTEIEGFKKVYSEIFGRNYDINKLDILGVRNNKYSTSVGIIKYYYEKLKFRDKKATTIDDFEQEEIFKEKKKIDDSSLLGKVYSYFFDN